MSDKLNIEIITPDQTILKSEATEVTIPSYEGQMGILKDHIPLITFLRPGLIIIKKNNSGEKKFFVEDGTVEFLKNNFRCAKHLRMFWHVCFIDPRHTNFFQFFSCCGIIPVWQKISKCCHIIRYHVSPNLRGSRGELGFF